MNSPGRIEIVGGGLAGLSLGLALRRHEVPVTICEAGEYPRHRVCGEFIAGLSAPTIARLGLAPFLHDALRHREVTWFHGDKRNRRQRLPSPAFGLSRYTLDARLAAAFVAAGGDLQVRTRVSDMRARPGRVFAHGRRPGKPAWLALKIHARNLPLDRELELHLGEQAYVGLAHLDDGQVNICGLFSRCALSGRGPGLIIAYLKACGLTALGRRLEAAELEPASFCAVAALAFDRQAVSREAGRIELGDTCAMIPPFTGNGMAMAFQSAEAALGPLVRYAHGGADWAHTCLATGRALRARFRVRLASAAMLHPFMLRPRRQQWLATLARSRLLPLGPLYSALH